MSKSIFGLTPLKSIFLYCATKCAPNREAVTNCKNRDCPLHYFRLGKLKQRGEVFVTPVVDEAENRIVDNTASYEAQK